MFSPVISSGKKISLYGQQWDKMKIGDSLSKKLNTTTIEVFKKDKVIQIDLRAYIEHLKKKMKQQAKAKQVIRFQ